MCDLGVVQHEYGGQAAWRDKGSGLFYDGKGIRTIEAVGHVAPSSRSQPFDTVPRAYSGQAVDLQEVTSEPACTGHLPAWLRAGADRPGIRLAEYCPVINHLFLWPWGDRQRSEVMPWVT